MSLFSGLQIVIILIQIATLQLASAEGSSNLRHGQTQNLKPISSASFNGTQQVSNKTEPLEGRTGDHWFVKDIVERLHALDADIGKLLYNSTTMYSPSEHDVAHKMDDGGKFSEVLNDLDSLQDEIGRLVTNATRTRQYNILVRLRPLNNILYRIRHNLHLMRNSLVAINAVSGLERLSNDVMDSTLLVFLKPDADMHEEFGDNGNYDINLDKTPDTTMSTTQAPSPSTIMVTSPASSPTSSRAKAPIGLRTTSNAAATTTTTTTTTITTTNTTPAPEVSPSSPSTTTTTTTTTTTRKPPVQRQTRRPNNRHPSRRTTTQRPTSAPRDE